MGHSLQKQARHKATMHDTQACLRREDIASSGRRFWYKYTTIDRDISVSSAYGAYYTGRIYIHIICNGTSDYSLRIILEKFECWYLDKCNGNPEFQTFILFSDEAIFSHGWIFNQHNAHMWSHDNPRHMHPHLPNNGSL